MARWITTHAASDYELGRPEWPAAAIDSLGLRPSVTVLDLGAGTGKLTRTLVARFARVIAVEPSDAMRAVLKDLVPGAESLAGAAEAIPLNDGSVDAVFVADAFHWFGTTKVVTEIARVLRPNGVLALLWYRRVLTSEPSIPDVFRRRIKQLRKGAPEHPYEQGTWRNAFEGGPFEPLRQASFEFSYVADRESVISNTTSSSWFVAKSETEQAAARKELSRFLPDASYRMTLEAELHWTRLRLSETGHWT